MDSSIVEFRIDVKRELRKVFRRLTLSRSLTRCYDWRSTDQQLGPRGELAAERYLLRRGWIVIERGYEDWFGEIDLIAVDGQTIVFVEVKTRSSDAKGHPAEAVDERKQIHLTKTAIGYMKRHNLSEAKIRFDVIAILWPDTTRPPSLEHYENAFEVAEHRSWV